MGSLKLIFGRESYVIHQRALGIDPTPVYPPRMEPAVAEEITLSQDENDDEKLLGVLYGLVEKCSYRLRQRSLIPGKAGLLFRYADQEEITRQILLSPASSWDWDLYEPLKALFLKACLRRVRVRFMKVWFKDFSAPSAQLSLFSPASAGKKVGVTHALDRIREKHGGEAIQYGRTAASHPGHAKDTEAPSLNAVVNGHQSTPRFYLST
jgi:DNA polymerase-4